MFADVERDESTDRRDGIECVQVEPLVLDCSPPELDQGVGARDLGLGEHTAEHTAFDELLDLGIDVLDARFDFAAKIP